MKVNRCYGCMEEITAYPCSHCGYQPGESPGYALAPGTILNGKYLVGKLLGQGGFGLTYIGWDLMLEQKVAIKEYYPSGQVVRQNGASLEWYGTQQAQTARDSGKDIFLKEARKMTRVRKIPQVVQVLDLFLANETAYIVMDFIEGETLKQRLQKTGPLSWQDARDIFLPVVQAMEQVHQAGLIHRDLSPDNLMLQPDGGVQILDLGAAKDLNLNSGVSSMQVAKSGFSPLEQYIQQGGSGTWTDVYALAATIYYTLTGILPPSAVDRLSKDSLRWDLPQLKALPSGVLHALQKAMAIRSEDRTQTMQELYQSLAASKGKATGKKKTSAKPKQRKPWKTALIATAALLVCAALAVGFLWEPVISPMLEYKEAEALLANGETARAAIAFGKLGNYKDSTERSLALWEEVSHHDTVSAGYRHTVGLKTDGTVVAVGSNMYGQCNVSGWKNIVAVSAGYLHTVGLQADGTLVAVGSNQFGKCNVGDWRNIVAISSGEQHTVGLRTDGSVVAVGSTSSGKCNVTDWQDIVAICTGSNHTVGLKSDGTVVAVGDNKYGQCNVNEWRDIVAVSSGENHTVGLKSDGTVISVGSNSHLQCNSSDWRNCIVISAGSRHTVGLKVDGTVVAVGDDDDSQCVASTWNVITAISAGDRHTVGLKADGTVVAVGNNEDGQCNVSGWKNIKLPN